LIANPKIVAAAPDWHGFNDYFGKARVDGARERFELLLDRWAEIHELKRNDLVPEADTEDWIENAVKLVSAVDTGLPTYLLDRTAPSEPIRIARRVNTNIEFEPENSTIFMGTVLRWDPCLSRHGEINFVWPAGGRLSRSDYWADETLMKALGRHSAVSAGDADGPDGYVATTLGLLAAGADKLLAKIVFQTKYQAPTRLSLPPDAAEDDVREAFYTAFEDNLLDCEARKECFLIQEVRTMLNEYRIVVVGGRPVAGAGTVEWLNPIFHDPSDGNFDPHVEYKRNDRNLVRDPKLVARYIDRAESLCTQLERRGVTEFRNCTMDFALDGQTHEVVLVETNPPDNFGLYALEFSPIIDSVLSECGIYRSAPGYKR